MASSRLPREQLQRLAQVEDQVGLGGRELDGLAVLRHRPRGVVLAAGHLAALGAQAGLLRLLEDGLVQQLLGLVQVAALPVGAREQQHRVEGVGVGPAQLLQRLLRGLGLAQREVGEAQAVERLHVVGAALQGGGLDLHGALEGVGVGRRGGLAEGEGSDECEGLHGLGASGRYST